MIRIHRLRPVALAISIALLLTACGTQPTVSQGGLPSAGPQTPPSTQLSPQMAAAADTLTKMAAMQDRLYRVAAPLLIDNAELCPKHARNLLGFTAKNRHYYPGMYNEAAHVAFGMDERLQVTGVLAGSGAAKAGLRLGDDLVAAGGKPLPTGASAPNTVGAIFGSLVASQPSLPLTIERDGRPRDLTIPVTRACGFGIELGNGDNVNAYADGSRIMVTRGMLGFTKSDDELAYVLARTMAHNILGHPAALRNKATLDSVIDNLTRMSPDMAMLNGSAGIKAAPANIDAAADRLAVFLLARADYNYEGAPAFWKRFAAAYPASVANGFTANHPATAARLTAIELAVEDVKTKKAGKKPLTP
ncbi:M48 family metalloprotease [Massilia sp. Dwa41.01b]|uniref:M48 family metallopeptidase n=1 Tax=Massilia sp. Dwa41.01b TaxID=2709302 RepID=UPI001600F533|nr:M48 family metallopeptidase [Massilia sp. Dwa41.01b]QNA90138.1 M48 family metalloprotease [Massilia sp. Dwa41.01b]